jgi:putative transposase
LTRYGLDNQQVTLHQDRGSPMIAKSFLAWYNHEHHHSGLNGFTPAQVYTGEFTGIAKNRQAALTRYYEKHSERFVRGKPTSALPPEAAHINSITSEDSGSEDSAAVNFPTLSAAREALARANRY